MATSSAGPIRLGAVEVTRDQVRCTDSHLFVAFALAGTGAGDWDPSDHVVIVRDGDDQKLRWIDGVSGVNNDGTAFVVWRLGWPGGDSIAIHYFDCGQALVAEQVVRIDAPDSNAGLKVLSGRSVSVGDGWLPLNAE
jgi:hypothetical protein